MTNLQRIEHYEFWAERFPIIREPGWDARTMGPDGVLLRRDRPFDEPTDYRNRTWALGIVIYPETWHYCWQAGMNSGGISDRLDIPLDSTPESAYAAAHAKASEWFEGQTKRMLDAYHNRTVLMEPGEE